MAADDERATVEEVLRYMLIGQRFCRMHFYGPPLLYVWGPKPPGIGDWFDAEDETHLWIESRWRLFDGPPATWPRSEDDLPALPMEELARVVCRLRDNRIVDARLGDVAPHLILTFDNDQVLFVNGHHDRYESWQLWGGSAATLLIVATPDDRLAYWVPANFRQG
jgi:hypothetical protein